MKKGAVTKWGSVVALVCVGCAGSKIQRGAEKILFVEGNPSGKIEHWKTRDMDSNSVLVVSYDSPQKLANAMKVYHRGKVVKECNDNELKEVNQNKYGKETFQYSWKNDVDCRVEDIYDTLELEILDSARAVSRYRLFNR